MGRAIPHIYYQKLISHINRKAWWHCPPADPTAYEKRGKFYASSFQEAEFWGRPLDEPQRVRISNPLVGDENYIQRELFGKTIPEPNPKSRGLLEWRWNLDAKMKKAALAKGYDATLLMTTKGFNDYKATGKIPRSIELNVLKI